MQNALYTEAIQSIKNTKEITRRFEGARVTITGAAGFLGSHFVHYFISLNELLENKCTVVAYDNFILGKPAWMDELTGRADLIFKQCDVAHSVNYEDCDYIIHAASIASPMFYRKFPIETMDVNVMGTRRILDFSRNNKIKSILYLSSSEVYGNPSPEMIPTPETYEGRVSSIGPRACYDESKRYGETMCVNFQRQYGSPVKIVRPFNVYGVGLKPDDGRVISDFFRDVITKGSIKMLSNGKATRTFCYISDAIGGFIRALLLGKDGEAYNIGNDTPEITMNELAEKIIDLTGGKATLEYCVSSDPEYLTDNPERRCPDLLKARSDLKYSPQITLDEGLERSYSYYKSLF